MAQFILDRVAAALRPNGRLVDCRKALADAETELAGLNARIAEAERNSTNPTVADEDARGAWERVQDFELLKRRLTRGIEELRIVIARKEEARRSEERASAYAEAKAARDALAERWREFGEVYAQFIELLRQTYESDLAIAVANRMLPAGAERLRSAELGGRGIPDGAVQRFVDLEWSSWDGRGIGWSIREVERRKLNETMQRDAARHAAAMAAERARNTPEAIAERQEREAARYRLYQLKPARYCGSGRIPVEHRGGCGGIGAEPSQLWMSEEQVAAAKEAGLIVEDVEAAGLKVEALPLLPSLDRESAYL